MFYKKMTEGNLFFGDIIAGPYVNLQKENKDNYEYPVDGWYWFDTEEEAREFFGLPPKEDTMFLPGMMPPNVI